MLAAVCDVDPTIKQIGFASVAHCDPSSRMLVQCCSSVSDGVPTFNQHWSTVHMVLYQRNCARLLRSDKEYICGVY